MLLNIKKRGNSLSIIVPKEMATSMNVEDGDILFATKTPSGYEISAYEPGFATKMAAAPVPGGFCLGRGYANANATQAAEIDIRQAITLAGYSVA